MAAKKKRAVEAPVALPERVQRFSEELSRVLEGWEYLDSELRVDGELLAELLGKIGTRLVFVHHIVGSKEEVVLAALKQVSRAGADARRLARQFELPVEVAPLVVVITEGKTKGLLKRLGAICPDPLVLFAERRLSSTAGRVRFLEELTPTGEVATRREAPVVVARGEEGEASPSNPNWDEVIARVDRIDTALERTEEEGEVRWTWGEESLCCIAVGLDGQLIGRIGTEGIQHTLGAGRSLEVFLDWVLAHHLELVEGGEGLRNVDLMPHRSEPLLTPEEIAAFQE
jgi:hypothetical protein